MLKVSPGSMKVKHETYDPTSGLTYNVSQKVEVEPTILLLIYSSNAVQVCFSPTVYGSTL